jgi:hypothetical protein
MRNYIPLQRARFRMELKTKPYGLVAAPYCSTSVRRSGQKSSDPVHPACHDCTPPHNLHSLQNHDVTDQIIQARRRGICRDATRPDQAMMSEGEGAVDAATATQLGVRCGLQASLVCILQP